jgi:hypothetical protein
MFALSQVVINLSARGLKSSYIPNKQFCTRCTVSVKNGVKSDFVEIESTEFSDDCFNPDWLKKFMIAFKFYEIQTLRFDVYRSPKSGENQQKIGATEISFAELVRAKDGFTMKTIKSDNEKTGKLLIFIKEVETSKEAIVMQFSGKDLDKKDLFGLSDPYLVISKIDRNGITKVYETEVIKGSLSPVWLPIKIRVKTLCDSDRKMRLQFDCFDWDRNKEDDLIGSFMTTLEQLLTGPSEKNKFECVNPNKLVENFKSYTHSGIVSLDSIQMIEEVSFMDYLKNGAQFHLKVSLDFSTLLTFNDSTNSTQSTNGTIDKANAFKSIIRSLCDITKQYEHQRLLAASGFGAVFPDNESTDYYELDTYFECVEDLIASYELLLKSVKPLPKRKSHKMVNFEPTICQTLQWIEKILGNERNNKLDYFILLIMTSEVNSDMIKTLDSVINKTFSKPISIIIIDNDCCCNTLNEENEDLITGITRSKRLNYRNNIQVCLLETFIDLK